MNSITHSGGGVIVDVKVGPNNLFWITILALQDCDSDKHSLLSLFCSLISGRKDFEEFQSFISSNLETGPPGKYNLGAN